MANINSPSVLCPACGAKIPDAGSSQAYVCGFCKFERRMAWEEYQPPTSPDMSLDMDISLPFQADLNGYFAYKFRSLEPGGLWHITTPVKRIFHAPAPLPGQINFFRAKNIMFLLEQHGFKMTWRRSRFSSTLTLTARRC